METQETLQAVVIHLASEEYALPIMKVQDINRLTPITKMPHAPAFMEGIINLRGKIIPIVDLRARFGLPVNEATDDTRIVIVEFNHQILGIIVDEVAEVLAIPMKDIDLPPAAAKLDQTYIRGIGKVDGRLLVLLDVDRIFTEQEIKDLRTVDA